MSPAKTVGWDAVVVGGGFYGCSLALDLRLRHGLPRVAVVERGPRLMERASLVNQARVHAGHHYPRDFLTARRSAASFRRFAERHRAAVVDSFTAVYAVAARGSQVSARQFEAAMAAAGARMSRAPNSVLALFAPGAVEAAWVAEEQAFDARALAADVEERMGRAGGIDVLLRTEAVEAVAHPVRGSGGWRVRVRPTAGGADPPPGNGAWLAAGEVYECAYGRFGRLPGLPPTSVAVKFELCEVCLVEPPEELRTMGVTVMDGPFFSCMPHPAGGAHSLTHVRWTPRRSWVATPGGGADGGPGGPDPYAEMDADLRDTRFDRMRADAARILPAMARARRVGSLWDVKAVLASREGNDARPVLVEGSPRPEGGFARILGGKIDNIWDALDRLAEIRTARAGDEGGAGR